LDCTLPHVEEGRGEKLCYFLLEKLKIVNIFHLYYGSNKLEKLRLISFIRKRITIFQNIYEFLAGSGTNMKKEKVKKTTVIGCVVLNAPPTHPIVSLYRQSHCLAYKEKGKVVIKAYYRFGS
jgi:hypothetical protein